MTTHFSHYTLNTGHLKLSPRSEVDERTIRFLDPLVAAGHGYIPIKDTDSELGFHLSHGPERCLLTIFHRCKNTRANDPPFILSALAWSEAAADEMWTAMRRSAAKGGVETVDDRPTQLPALFVLLTPMSIHVPPPALATCADLERCLVWTILAQHGLSI